MEQKKISRVHLVRTSDFKKEDYNALVQFLESVCKKEKRKNIFISYDESLTIPVSKLKDAKIKMSDVEELIKSPYFSNLYNSKTEKDKLKNLAKTKKQKSTGWNVLFGLCEEFRNKHKEIGKDEYVIILTNTTNREDYFSALDDKTGKNGFVHTDLWDFFLPGYDKIYPISYEIIGLIVHSNMGASYSELADKLAHKKPLIGCISDFCDNKTEINIKIRTGDICENCLERVKQHINFEDVYFLLKFLDEIRNETLRTLRYLNINKKISAVNILTKNGKSEIIFVDFNKKLPLSSPLQKAVYIYLLNNKEGIATPKEDFPTSLLNGIVDIYKKEAKGKNKEGNKASQLIRNQFSQQKGKKPLIYPVISKINAVIKKCVIGKQPTEEYKIHTIVDEVTGFNTYKVKLKTSKIKNIQL